MAPAPYFVAAGSAEGAVVVRTATATGTMSPVEFADHLGGLAAVRALPTDVPVVLVVPRAGAGGLDLPRLVAARTGRTVWSHSGQLELLPSPDGTATRISVLVGGQEEMSGRWLRSLPGDLGAVSAEERARATPPSAVRMTTVDGRTVVEADIVHHTIQDAKNRPLGRVSLAPQEMERRKERLPELGALRASRVWDRVDGEYESRPGGVQALPWKRDLPGVTPYFFMAHGWTDNVRLHTAAGGVTVDGTNLGRFLKRRPSLSGLPPQVPIVLASCRTGGETEQPGPNVAQLVADETGRVVYAPTSRVDSRLHLMAWTPDEDGVWLTFRPGRSDTDEPASVRVPDGRGPATPVARAVTDAVAPVTRPVGAEAGMTSPSQERPPAALRRHVVQFAENAEALSVEQRRELRRFAQETARMVLADHRAGLPLPRLRVEAGGNGGVLPLPGRADAAMRTSQRRGEAVVAELRQAVREELRELQPGPGAVAVMDDSHFSVVPLGRAAGRDVPQDSGESREDLRRRAVVTVLRSQPQDDTLGPALGDELAFLDADERAGRSVPEERPARPEPVASERIVPVPDAVPIVSRRNTRGDIGLDFRPDGVRRLDETAPPEVWTTYVTGPAGPDGTRPLQPERPPWFSLSVSAPVPYFVVADTAYGAVLVRTAEGGDAMRPAEFADHLAALPQVRALPADAPVVLVMSRGGAGGLELPRLVAARTGRTVWAHTGELELVPSPDGTVTRITVVGEGVGEVSGRWLRSLPDDLGAVSAEERARVAPPRAARLTALDGRPVAGAEIVHQTIQDEQHRPLGRASLAPQQWAEPRHWQLARRLDAGDSFRVWDGADGAYAVRPGSLRPLPWRHDLPGVTPYFFMAHGDTDHVDLHTEAGVRQVDGTNLGRFLKRRPSLSRLPSRVPVVLVACFTGEGTQDPGRNVAQLVADETGRAVYAPTTRVEIRLDLYPSTPGDATEWLVFRPRRPDTAGPAPVPPRQPEQPSHPHPHPRPRTGTRHRSRSRHQGHDDRNRGDR